MLTRKIIEKILKAKTTRPRDGEVKLPNGQGVRRQRKEPAPLQPSRSARRLSPPAMTATPRQTIVAPLHPGMVATPRPAVVPPTPPAKVSPRQAVAPAPPTAMAPSPRQAVAPAPPTAMTLSPRHAVAPAPPTAMTLSPRHAVAPAPPTAMTLSPRHAVAPAPPTAMTLSPRHAVAPAPPTAMALSPRHAVAPAPPPAALPPSLPVVDPAQAQQLARSNAAANPMQRVYSRTRVATGKRAQIQDYWRGLVTNSSTKPHTKPTRLMGNNGTRPLVGLKPRAPLAARRCAEFLHPKWDKAPAAILKVNADMADRASRPAPNNGHKVNLEEDLYLSDSD